MPTTLVLTDLQVAGRGRGDHQWSASPGALTFSLILDSKRFEIPPTLLSLATAMSVVENLDRWLPTGQFSIKWPNDVFSGQKKIAGLLIESKPDATVVGIGINISNEAIPEHGTSLFRESPDTYSLHSILDHQLTQFFATLRQAQSDPQVLIQRCASRMLYMDQIIQLKSGSKDLTGTFTGLNESGCLILEIENIRHTIISATGIRLAVPG